MSSHLWFITLKIVCLGNSSQVWISSYSDKDFVEFVVEYRIKTSFIMISWTSVGQLSQLYRYFIVLKNICLQTFSKVAKGEFQPATQEKIVILRIEWDLWWISQTVKNRNLENVHFLSFMYFAVCLLLFTLENFLMN